VAGRLLERLGSLDLDAVAVNLHHEADLLERVLGEGPVYMREEWLRGTAGALAGASAFLRAGAPFLVASGDGVHEIELQALIEHHARSGAAATITVKRLPRPESCAVVELDDDARVVRFVEKPRLEDVFSDLASIGVYCFEPEVLELIAADRPMDIAGELIPQLLASGLPVSAYLTDAWWSDIGTPEELLAANLALARGGVHVYDGSRVAPDARLEGVAVVGPDAVVGAGAVVRDALVLPGAVVPGGRLVEAAIYGDGAAVARTWLSRA
jgi:NDP-sugar pyrophosphorylase family protein